MDQIPDVRIHFITCLHLVTTRNHAWLAWKEGAVSDQQYQFQISCSIFIKHYNFRGGVYPASACLKISGFYGNHLQNFLDTQLYWSNLTSKLFVWIFQILKNKIVFTWWSINSWSPFLESGENVTIRSCGVDAGTLTADTEIVRLSHCGSLIIDERYCSTCTLWLITHKKDGIMYQILINYTSDISMAVLKYVMM